MYSAESFVSVVTKTGSTVPAPYPKKILASPLAQNKKKERKN